MTKALFEEWIAYANKRVYVPVEDHLTYANQPGWFPSGWRGDAQAVERLRKELRPAPASQEASEVME
jgi:hypothetical protein